MDLVLSQGRNKVGRKDGLHVIKERSVFLSTTKMHRISRVVTALAHAPAC